MPTMGKRIGARPAHTAGSPCHCNCRSSASRRLESWAPSGLMVADRPVERIVIQSDWSSAMRQPLSGAIAAALDLAMGDLARVDAAGEHAALVGAALGRNRGLHGRRGRHDSVIALLHD